LLARLEEGHNQDAAAARNYEAALCTFEAARSSVHHEESKLPFFTNASRIYDDYISFLIRSGQTKRALEVADYSRGRTLAEGLGYLKNDRPCSTPSVTPERVSAGANANILYYWLGQHQSYLWAINSHATHNFILPPASRIETIVRRYREALVNGEDVLSNDNQDGTQLYQTLVAPAESFLPKNSRVIIVPDGSLTGLNFETLLVPGNPTPHYWIEDAVIANAQSLRLMVSEKGNARPRAGKMLLMGDAVPHPPEFPALANAKLEIQNVEKHFSKGDLSIYSQSSATAASFLDNKPEQYTYIHFAAHAVASSQVPLDSAVILSPRSGEDSFKLYARDIIQHHLRARLVTVSACYGAGTRAYNGEGLIGLSWAFLRAGARNTIGALWEVNDSSTPQLMDRFYAEIKEGRPPEISLRDAKLSLMRSNKVFSKPFYWAPFQLYGTSWG
jgi:CHAT domain-containing protein